MKKHITFAGIFLLTVLTGNLGAQSLTGGTLSPLGGEPPVLSVSSLVYPVVSPTCAYDQLDIGDLFVVAFSSPSTSNVGVAAVILLNLGFSEAAVRLFMVAELCDL